ncbi:putative membrane protein DUF2306 [Larkinella arboricola]|uniref:Putative membrane protein DUF2306 n=1 Tax=Larkinella arboricola TaxID=643671 RepID=A0A327X3V0_LARAB|nr:DUF2306 domain-containing protein [Larkinella arboricola]RAJ97618.1 putative membrane protein DUF2306 [Larkinella arboricola]
MTRAFTDAIPQQATSAMNTFSSKALNGSGILLVATVWGSAALFGLYILAFYAAALYEGNMERWNQILPGLYERESNTATTGIGLHFATGGIILILGSIQLIKAIRVRFPALHRWIGRLYVLSALLAAIGGLIFIALKGTIGGPVMSLGFGLYGILMFVSAIETYRHAVAGRLEKHRRWALRLYALAIGSWLYRMDYGFWLLLTDGLGHTRTFSGPFDHVMDFFFYIPNLLVAEAFIRARQYQASSALRLGASLLLMLATGFLLVGTYYFTIFYWGPAILGWLTRA